jgi:hypothetical protein
MTLADTDDLPGHGKWCGLCGYNPEYEAEIEKLRDKVGATKKGAQDCLDAADKLTEAVEDERDEYKEKLSKLEAELADAKEELELDPTYKRMNEQRQQVLSENFMLKSKLEKFEDIVEKLEAKYVIPLLGTCATCRHALYGGPKADADDCQREEYDGSDPECVENWWEANGQCKKWEQENE